MGVKEANPGEVLFFLPFYIHSAKKTTRGRYYNLREEYGKLIYGKFIYTKFLVDQSLVFFLDLDWDHTGVI